MRNLCDFSGDDRKCPRCGFVSFYGHALRECTAASDQTLRQVQPTSPPTHGPGTELSRLLKRIGINPTPTCQCRAMSQKMDQWGPDECERPERIDEVVAVMREEATARGLPFLDVAGRMLVRRAIRNARKAAAIAQP